jgi:hypothetical protein
MFKKLLCFLGIHNWSKWSDCVVVDEGVLYNKENQRKICYWCNKADVRTIYVRN